MVYILETTFLVPSNVVLDLWIVEGWPNVEIDQHDI
jgi:hypothetical protein